MTREQARREIDSLDFYLQNHTDDYGEESHTAMMMAKDALSRSEIPNTCGDAISRQAVLDVTWEEPSYTDALNVLTEVRDKVKALPPVNPQKPICPSAGVDCEDCPAYEKKSEWQRDHEILKAYSDGANEVLDKIREEIKTLSNANPSYWHSGDMVEREEVFEIIDKYQSEIPTGSEGSGKE